MTAIERPKTLAEILAWLDAVDNGLIAATPEDQAHVGALLVAKIDNTAEVIDELEFQEKRLREAAARLTDGARKVASRVKRIEGYMAYHMKTNGFTQIPGEVWKAKLTKSKAVEPFSGENPADHPCFHRAKFEWDKKALKAALDAGVEGVPAEFVESVSVSIDVNKGKILS